MSRINRIMGAIVLMGSVALGTVSAEAAEPKQPGDEISHRIVVVNESATPVRVLLEDADGRRHELGGLERGETKMFEAPAEILARGDFRVRVHPGYYAQHVRDPVKITTGALNIADDETVILWLERELSRSKVEVRAG